MKKKKKVNAAILVIGNEILSGRTQDKNVAFISNWLNKMESLYQRSELYLTLKTIINNVRLLSKNFNYVFTTGGIGPTHDDITAQSISKAFNVKYGYHKEAYKILENYYESKNLMTEEKMAKMPKRQKLIYNPSCGARLYTKNVLSFPGVPSILNSMIENSKNT